MSFRGAAIQVGLGNPLPDGTLELLRNVQVFTDLSRMSEDPLVLKAENTDSPLVGGLSGREAVRHFMLEYITKELAPESNDYKKVVGMVPPLLTKSVQESRRGKFSVSELRDVQSFMKRMIQQNQPGWFDSFIESFSLGDLKILSDLAKDGAARNAFRVASQTGKEVDDKQAIGLLVPWKGPNGASYADILAGKAANVKEIGAVAHNRRSKDIDKILGSARENVAKNGISEDASKLATDNHTWRFAVRQADLVAYAQLSSSWDNETGWVKPPDDLSAYAVDAGEAQVRKSLIEGRIEKASEDASVAARALELKLSSMQLAQLIELQLRDVNLARSISQDWGISFTDAWEHQLNGRLLIDRSYQSVPSRWVGDGAQSVIGLHRLVATTEFTDHPLGKVFAPRIPAIVFFIAGWFLLCLANINLLSANHDPHLWESMWIMLVLASIWAVVMSGWARLDSGFWIVFGVWVMVAMVVGAIFWYGSYMNGVRASEHQTLVNRPEVHAFDNKP